MCNISHSIICGCVFLQSFALQEIAKLHTRDTAIEAAEKEIAYCIFKYIYCIYTSTILIESYKDMVYIEKR